MGEMINTTPAKKCLKLLEEQSKPLALLRRTEKTRLTTRLFTVMALWG
jgi:hypothetical protein